jgi:hypothetical protein
MGANIRRRMQFLWPDVAERGGKRVNWREGGDGEWTSKGRFHQRSRSGGSGPYAPCPLFSRQETNRGTLHLGGISTFIAFCPALLH